MSSDGFPDSDYMHGYNAIMYFLLCYCIHVCIFSVKINLSVFYVLSVCIPSGGGPGAVVKTA